MARILGFRVQNYRCLRDVSIGVTSGHRKGPVLSGLTAFIGKNGTGKSSLLDAFSFLSDCVLHGVEDACNRGQRGGFHRLLSKGCAGPIVLEIRYREGEHGPPIDYRLEVGAADNGRPQVESEELTQRPRGRHHDGTLQYLALKLGRGPAFFGLTDPDASGMRSPQFMPVVITDRAFLGVAALGVLETYPFIDRLRTFLGGWYLSYFQPNAARGLPIAGLQPHLNTSGDNLGNVVQFMEGEYPDRFKAILQQIASRIPGVRTISTEVTKDNRVLLRFNDGNFQDPFYAQQMSDGTLKLFAYLLLLNAPKPAPLICIEEPENGLYHKLLEVLVQEFRIHTDRADPSSQIVVATHHPYFVDALSPKEVWILDKGPDGFSTARRASDLELVRNMVEEGIPLGSLWYSNYLDPR